MMPAPWMVVATMDPEGPTPLTPYCSRWAWLPGWDDKRFWSNIDSGGIISAQRREPNGTMSQVVKIVAQDRMDVVKPPSPYNRYVVDARRTAEGR